MTTNKTSVKKVRRAPSLFTQYHLRPNWHPADIIAELHKKGTTLAALSRESGLSSSTLSNALSRPWPRGEMLIAKALGVTPAEIWPKRYFNENGKPIVKTLRK
jgi:Ner family transcriptional regulator